MMGEEELKAGLVDARVLEGCQEVGGVVEIEMHRDGSALLVARGRTELDCSSGRFRQVRQGRGLWRSGAVGSSRARWEKPSMLLGRKERELRRGCSWRREE